MLPLPKIKLSPEPSKKKAPPKPIVQIPPPPTEEEQATIKQEQPPAPPEPKTAEEARKLDKKQQRTQIEQIIDAQTGVTEKTVKPIFQPVDYFQALASQNPTLAFVMLRQIRDMDGPMPNTANGALGVMTKLQGAISKGQDITAFNPEITVHVTGQSERNELMFSLLDAHDMERMVELLQNRAKFEDFVSACSRRSDLTINEAMSLASYTQHQLDSIFAKLRPKAGSRGESTREPTELVTRANLPTQLQRRELQDKFEEASPQEREILRKLGFKLENLIAAKITKTTTTETVEVVQKDGTGTPAPTGQ